MARKRRDSRHKVVLICPLQGRFAQLPGNHLRGQGLLKSIDWRWNSLGHVESWPAETRPDWLAFSPSHAAIGMPIHFHLTANRGLVDEHLSFSECADLYAGADREPRASRRGARFIRDQRR